MLCCPQLQARVCRSAERPGALFIRPTDVRQHGTGLELASSLRSRSTSFPTAMATATAEEATEQDFTWKGSDSFSHLDDRKDATPLALPTLTESKRVVLVRHGQSTWNAEGRIQGSTDFAELTEKGRAQADTTRTTVSQHVADADNCHSMTCTAVQLHLNHCSMHRAFASKESPCRCHCLSRCCSGLLVLHNCSQQCLACLQLLEDNFDMLVHSPLARAAQTAEIVWGNRTGPVHVLPSLREIDLYSFQVPLPAQPLCRAVVRMTVTNLSFDFTLLQCDPACTES